MVQQMDGSLSYINPAYRDKGKAEHNPYLSGVRIPQGTPPNNIQPIQFRTQGIVDRRTSGCGGQYRCMGKGAFYNHLKFYMNTAPW